MKALTFDDVLLIPSYNHYDSRKVVTTQMKDKTKKLVLDLPIISSNMDTITGHKMANFMSSYGAIGAIHRFMSVKDNLDEFLKCKGDVFVSIGCGDEELKRLEVLYSAGAHYICVDVAHAHAKYVGKMLKRVRDLVGDDACVMAGNVATYAGADYLVSCGADIVKVGIGSGSVCTTRIKTGFGVPMITAIQDCAKINRSIVADGGIRYPGDIVKALAFGADFVMIGGMLAGTEPTPNWQPGTVCYRGMASRDVLEENNKKSKWKTDEGVSVSFDAKRNEDQIISDIIGGLRSGLTYSGSIDIRELQRKLNYIEITNSGLIESHAHFKI